MSVVRGTLESMMMMMMMRMRVSRFYREMNWHTYILYVRGLTSEEILMMLRDVSYITAVINSKQKKSCNEKGR